jgi:hypothetical protein
MTRKQDRNLGKWPGKQHPGKKQQLAATSMASHSETKLFRISSKLKINVLAANLRIRDEFLPASMNPKAH